MKKKLLYLLLAVCLSPILRGQTLTAPLISGSWQSTYHNPAMGRFLEDELTIGLPGIGNDLRLENIGYRSLREREGGRRILQLEAWADAAGETNEVENLLSTETLGLAYRRGPYTFSFHHRLRTEGEAAYPGSLIGVAARGNAQFIGQTVEIAPRGSIISFQEVALGMSYDINETFTVGARLKYLAGVSDIRTGGNGSLQLTTGEENFALTLDQDYTLHSVGALDYRSLDEPGFRYDPNRLDLGALGGPNTGFGVDLGVTAELDRLRLQLSVTDLLAGIEWREEVTTLRFTGSQTFTGLDVLQDLLRDTVSLAPAVDSLLATYEPERSAEAYHADLQPTVYLGGEYEMTERLVTGGMIVLEDRLGSLQPAVAVTGRYAVRDWLWLGVNAHYRAGLRPGVSFHAYATPGPVRLFAAVDASLVGFRLGAALGLNP